MGHSQYEHAIIHMEGRHLKDPDSFSVTFRFTKPSFSPFKDRGDQNLAGLRGNNTAVRRRNSAAGRELELKEQHVQPAVK